MPALPPTERRKEVDYLDAGYEHLLGCAFGLETRRVAVYGAVGNVFPQRVDVERPAGDVEHVSEHAVPRGNHYGRAGAANLHAPLHSGRKREGNRSYRARVEMLLDLERHLSSVGHLDVKRLEQGGQAVVKRNVDDRSTQGGDGASGGLCRWSARVGCCIVGCHVV
jgi:hypothetical protein